MRWRRRSLSAYRLNKNTSSLSLAAEGKDVLIVDSDCEAADLGTRTAESARRGCRKSKTRAERVCFGRREGVRSVLALRLLWMRTPLIASVGKSSQWRPVPGRRGLFACREVILLISNRLPLMRLPRAVVPGRADATTRWR